MKRKLEKKARDKRECRQRTQEGPRGRRNEVEGVLCHRKSEEGL